MSIHVIRMPDLGEGIAEVEVVAWHVVPGDAVAEDQALADVMTDKATVEIPSPVAGTVLALGGEVGQMLAVGSELIRIELADTGRSPTLTTLTTPAAPAASPATVVAPSVALSLAPSVAPSMTAPLPRHPEPTPPVAQQRPIASPAVRARAWELGVELKDVAASGTAGRVMQADLEAHVARRAPHAVAPTPTPPIPIPIPIPISGSGSGSGSGSRAVSTSDVTQTQKIVGLRRKIAQRMQESKRRIPHFTYVEEVDVSELEALRARLNAKWGAQRTHLTLLAFLIRAMVLAAREFPQVNARFDDEAGVITRHAAVHMGIATQTAAGLMVPVLHDAQAHDLWSCAAEVLRLADAARGGTIVRHELTGSTITITSLGRLGGIMSTPVINHPEVAIVGVNRIVLRPAIRNGAMVARQLMNLSSSFDHRVVDGADAAAFVQCLREYFEHPATLFVD